MKALLIGSGQINDYSAIGKSISHLLGGPADSVICCDGGAFHAKQLGIVPDIIVGDLDSIDRETREYFEIINIPFAKFNAEKDFSDLELGLQAASDANKIVIIGATGTRLDHTLSNIGLLYKCLKAGKEAYIVSESGIIFLINKDIKLRHKANQTISLIPFSKNVTGIGTKGLKYPLNSENLSWGTTRGVSNVFLGEEAEISIKSGILIVVISSDE